MKFFIPAATDDANAELIYGAIRQFLSEELGADLSHDRIFRLVYIHEQKDYQAQVGKVHALNNEPVVAILFEPVRNLYHVCTTNRGVSRGISILVGAHEIRSREYFEPGDGK
jgi:hypothetical protein